MKMWNFIYALWNANKKVFIYFHVKVASFISIKRENVAIIFIDICCSTFSSQLPYFIVVNGRRFVSIRHYVHCSVITREKISKSCYTVYLLWHQIPNWLFIIHFLRASSRLFYLIWNIRWKCDGHHDRYDGNDVMAVVLMIVVNTKKKWCFLLS